MSKNDPEHFRVIDYLHPRFWLMWIFIGLLRLAALLPYTTQLKMGRNLGRLLKRILPSRRRIVDTNLELCFPDKTLQERHDLRDHNYENLGVSILEMAMCWWWKPQQLKPLVEVHGLENVENCLRKGQGVLLLSGHFTSLEIGGRLLSLVLPFQAMYRPQKNPLFDSLLYQKRKGYLVDIIPRKNTRRMIKGIKNLIPTWYAPDQDFPRERNAFAPFFGIQTATITASARLTKSSGAAILPFYPERKKDGSGYILWIKPALENFPSGNDITDATIINESIEKYVRLIPDQYMWLHKRFKTRPPGEPRIY
jgi:KDO2-lipid IV(A) lauroyltransferase